MNESRHTWMSHVTHMNQSDPHICISHVTHLKESRHTCERVKSRVWISHVAHMNESRHTYELFTSHIWVRHVAHMNESHHPYELPLSSFSTCDITRSYTWLVPLTSVSWLIHMNESCHTLGWVMSLDSSIWMGHVTHMNGSCQTCMSHVTPMNESCHTRAWVMSYTRISHVTHTHERPLR